MTKTIIRRSATNLTFESAGTHPILQQIYATRGINSKDDLEK